MADDVTDNEVETAPAPSDLTTLSAEQAKQAASIIRGEDGFDDENESHEDLLSALDRIADGE